MTFFLAIVGPLLHPYPGLGQAFLVAVSLHRYFCSRWHPPGFSYLQRLRLDPWTHLFIYDQGTTEERREASKRCSRLETEKARRGNNVYGLRDSEQVGYAVMSLKTRVDVGRDGKHHQGLLTWCERTDENHNLPEDAISFPTRRSLLVVGGFTEPPTTSSVGRLVVCTICHASNLMMAEEE
ncbi:hypothetical protein QBC39DRAFT_137930 [Podospora conica]|nr:hypothetical protein QBC39DRAFT_137930 [Schizothecium conicum]